MKKPFVLFLLLMSACAQPRLIPVGSSTPWMQYNIDNKLAAVAVKENGSDWKVKLYGKMDKVVSALMVELLERKDEYAASLKKCQDARVSDPAGKNAKP